MVWYDRFMKKIFLTLGIVLLIFGCAREYTYEMDLDGDEVPDVKIQREVEPDGTVIVTSYDMNGLIKMRMGKKNDQLTLIEFYEDGQLTEKRIYKDNNTLISKESFEIDRK